MIHPVGDTLKVKVETDQYGYGGDAKGIETGIVVAVPENLFYFGKHSQIVESSFLADLKDLKLFFTSLIGKKIWWESLQDRGRHLKEADGEFVYLKMSDVMCYSDSSDEADLASSSEFRV